MFKILLPTMLPMVMSSFKQENEHSSDSSCDINKYSF